jgi:hypothetical protein
MTHVYLLYSLERLRSGEQQVLFVVRTARGRRLRAIKRLGNRPGFKKSPKVCDHNIDHADGFNINRVRLGDDKWSDGFSIQGPTIGSSDRTRA